MLIIVIFVLAAGILAYFAFYAGKDAGFQEAAPQVESPVLADSVITASVKNKYVMPGARNVIVHMAAFDCDDGVEREFALQKEIFDAISIDQRDQLIYSGAIFLGFGEYGGIEIDGDAAADILNAGDFSHDDFDERIDVEQSIESPDGAHEDLSVGDKEAFDRFRSYGKLPEKSEQLADETESLAKYQAGKLLQRITVYPFLKREEKIARMFESTYRDAVDDMLGYDGSARQGQAADSVFLNGNEVRLVVTVQEQQPPLRCTVTAEFGVND